LPATTSPACRDTFEYLFDVADDPHLTDLIGNLAPFEVRKGEARELGEQCWERWVVDGIAVDVTLIPKDGDPTLSATATLAISTALASELPTAITPLPHPISWLVDHGSRVLDELEAEIDDDVEEEGERALLADQVLTLLRRVLTDAGFARRPDHPMVWNPRESDPEAQRRQIGALLSRGASVLRDVHGDGAALLVGSWGEWMQTDEAPAGDYWRAVERVPLLVRVAGPREFFDRVQIERGPQTAAERFAACIRGELDCYGNVAWLTGAMPHWIDEEGPLPPHEREHKFVLLVPRGTEIAIGPSRSPTCTFTATRPQSLLVRPEGARHATCLTEEL
jgi:hypothetical protein